jgi:hypothetical protein
MESRLIFLHQLYIKVTENRGGYVRTEVYVEPSPRAKRSHKNSSKKSDYSSPYRKPTQAVEEKILRRSSESRLRNSAN